MHLPGPLRVSIRKWAMKENKSSVDTESFDDPEIVGERLYGIATDLFPICRSLTGEGTHETLRYLQDRLPGMTIESVPSGTRAFDWTVPDEWNIRDAYIETPDGSRLASFHDSNLHVVGYSEPVDRVMDLDELQEHIHSLPGLPDAVPYITSYYKRYWGFCLSHRQREALLPGRYRAFIDSSLAPGALRYGELILPGETNQEILLSTYCCHPSLANNELSGPCVTTGLAMWLMRQPRRRYTYRILFLVETIGAIIYLSRHLAQMKANTVAGFVLTCCGDDNRYSYNQSRTGDTLADRVARHVLKYHAPDFVEYRFLDNGGSDDRQYCSPSVDLPVCSIMRSAYDTFVGYHNSLDNLDFISPGGLGGAFDAYRKAITLLEHNRRYRLITVGEPQLGKRGLYPSISTPQESRRIRLMKKFLAFADGRMDLIEMAERFDCFALDLIPIAETCDAAAVVEPQ
jgi:aminopeptidase-like protein